MNKKDRISVWSLIDVPSISVMPLVSAQFHDSYKPPSYCLYDGPNRVFVATNHQKIKVLNLECEGLTM